MVKKAPRRTAERILETALTLFNRYGEPQVSTGQLAAELGISAGNLHYHYPTKDGLVNALFDHYVEDLTPLLAAASDTRDVEDAWFFVHSLIERIWGRRFLYRDLNLLLARNRHLELGMRRVLLAQTAALRQMLEGLRAGDALINMEEETSEEASQLDQLATMQGVLLSHGLNHDYALNPRQAPEQSQLQNAVLRGAAQALGLLLPYLIPAQQALLRHLLRAYQPEAPTPQGSRQPIQPVESRHE